MAAIIFDFDGTIADTIDYFINYMAREAKLEPLTKEQKSQLHGKSLVRIARDLGNPWWKMPLLYYRGRRIMEPYLKDIKSFKGMPIVIKKLHAEGHELFVVSSNSVHNIRTFLRRENLRTSFLEIYGGVVVFGKAPAIRKLIKEHNLEVKNTVYVGDELRDIQAAQAVGIRVVAVGWGFAKTADLKAHKPTAIAQTPDDLLRILEII